ncbi:MAG: transglutaminase-like domain-containing protein [Lachnospiraceae bacterium]|nr:transglutaminase-like domain-containing protein [Lachnospiraceae bacterium]
MRDFGDAYKDEMKDIQPSEDFKRGLIEKMKAEQAAVQAGRTMTENMNSGNLAGYGAAVNAAGRTENGAAGSKKASKIRKIIGISAAVAACAAIVIGSVLWFGRSGSSADGKDAAVQYADSGLNTDGITSQPSGDKGESATLPSGDESEPTTPSPSDHFGSYVKYASKHVLAYGEKITVADIKEAYGVNDSKEIMPLYNVAQDEVFSFTFNFDGYDANIDLYDYVSVHTDRECKEESKIYFTAYYVVEDGITHYTAAPMEPVLGNLEQRSNYAYERVDTWGNAPMYYLAIHYDMEKTEPVKLEQPIIIPFTVKNEVNAPNAKGVVDATGRLKLVWEPVEGAEKYMIYKLTDGSLYTGSDNHSIDGARVGYKNLTLLWEDETTECEFDNFAGGQHGMALFEDNIGIYNVGQNYCVNGEYYITAVVNGVESGVSAPIKTSDLSIPYLVEDEKEILFNSYKDITEFPKEIEVLYIDGTRHMHPIYYERVEGVDLFGFKRIQYNYSIVGTALTGYVYPEEENHELGLQWVGVPEDNEPAMVKPVTDFSMIPDNNVATIIRPEENSPDTEQPDEVTDDGALNPDDAGLIGLQAENTQEHIRLGNLKSVDNLPVGVYIFADSAEEEWLALNLVQANTEISVEAFPALQDPYVLVDVLGRVFTQNNFILGVASYEYDYNTLTLYVRYNLTKEEIVKMQDGFARKAQQLADELSKESRLISDSVSAKETQITAFYNYLRENVEYDSAAAEASAKNDHQKSELAEYEYSFNAYGALMLKKGVCLAYASAFKLFCDLSGIECEVVTGYVKGDRPHAWNEFVIEGKRYKIDASSDIDLGNRPFVESWEDNELTRELNYTEDDYYKIESELS